MYTYILIYFVGTIIRRKHAETASSHILEFLFFGYNCPLSVLNSNNKALVAILCYIFLYDFFNVHILYVFKNKKKIFGKASD